MSAAINITENPLKDWGRTAEVFADLALRSRTWKNVDDQYAFGTHNNSQKQQLGAVLAKPTIVSELIYPLVMEPPRLLGEARTTYVWTKMVFET